MWAAEVLCVTHLRSSLESLLMDRGEGFLMPANKTELWGWIFSFFQGAEEGFQLHIQAKETSHLQTGSRHHKSHCRNKGHKLHWHQHQFLRCTLKNFLWQIQVRKTAKNHFPEKIPDDGDWDFISLSCPTSLRNPTTPTGRSSASASLLQGTEQRSLVRSDMRQIWKGFCFKGLTQEKHLNICFLTGIKSSNTVLCSFVEA